MFLLSPTVVPSASAILISFYAVKIIHVGIPFYGFYFKKKKSFGIANFYGDVKHEAK